MIKTKDNIYNQLIFFLLKLYKWYVGDKTRQLCTGNIPHYTTSYRFPTYKWNSLKIKCNKLIDILNVDTNRQVICVEPNVTIAQIKDTIIPLGWTLAVTPTFDNLTVGGLVMGSGFESSSHKFGLFQHICESYELFLSDGSLVRCSKDNDPDLFYAIPWSYGTLGFLTSVELKIIPCTKYIKVQYHPFNSLNALINRLEKESINDENDFIDAIMVNANDGVIITGHMVANEDVEKNKINKIARWYKPWFFKHVIQIMSQNLLQYEYIPLQDYYSRYSKSVFWEMASIAPFGNHPIFRYPLGWLYPAITLLLRLIQRNTFKRIHHDKHVVKDSIIPLSGAQLFIETVDSLLQIHPLRICPIKLDSSPGMVHSQSDNEIYFNIGIYGRPKVQNYCFWRYFKERKALEDLTVKLNGYQMLYGENLMGCQQFHKMFDHTLYDEMRQKLNCQKAFPDVFNKIMCLDGIVLE